MLGRPPRAAWTSAEHACCHTAEGSGQVALTPGLDALVEATMASPAADQLFRHKHLSLAVGLRLAHG